MNTPLWTRLALRSYPREWRERYGEELESLLEASGAANSWRARLDLAVAGGRERIHQIGLGPRDDSPSEGVRSGVGLVLCAWSLFVIAGMGVQKYSEHWQDVTPTSSRTLPGSAFDTLVTAAAVGSLLVLAGIALLLPALWSHLRAGGWRTVRGPILRAAQLTTLAVPFTAGFVIWAHRLTDAQRNGSDTAYTAVGCLWLVVLVSCLAAWTIAAVRTSREVALTPLALRGAPILAAAVTVAMAVMTIATTVWWGALANTAPAFFGHGGTSSSLLAPMLDGAAVLMLVATAAGVAGTSRALRSVRR